MALLLSAAEVTRGLAGAVVSSTRVWVPGVAETLPAVSRAVTLTALLPLALRLSVPVVGVAVARLTDQPPLPSAVVV